MTRPAPEISKAQFRNYKRETKVKLTRPLLNAVGVSVALASLAANAGVTIHPVIVAPAPVVVVPQPVIVAPVVAYVPNPMDVYILAAPPADIIFINGDTYIWTTDAYGHRVRRFYGHGDHREFLNHRREELHRVRERNGGHLPPHGESQAEAMAHHEQHMAAEHAAHGQAGPGHPGAPAMHPGNPAPAAHAAPPGAHAAAPAAAPAHAAPQAHAAPAAPAHAAPAHNGNNNEKK